MTIIKKGSNCFSAVCCAAIGSSIKQNNKKTVPPVPPAFIS